MRSLADRATAIALALAVVGCTGTMPSSPASFSPAPPSLTPTLTVTPDVTATPAPEPSPLGIDLPKPGQPFDAAALLNEMRSSTRPGGVPDALKTQAVATALARTVWTVDGSAWDTMAVSGFCGTSTCTVELAGTRIGRAGEDLWILEVSPATADVRVVSSEVRSLPWELVDALDELARSLDAAGVLEPMLLTTARWLPPADGDRFVLSYRSGGEEGSCAREVTLDAMRGEVMETTSTGC